MRSASDNKLRSSSGWNAINDAIEANTKIPGGWKNKAYQEKKGEKQESRLHQGSTFRKCCKFEREEWKRAWSGDLISSTLATERYTQMTDVSFLSMQKPWTVIFSLVSKGAPLEMLLGSNATIAPSNQPTGYDPPDPDKNWNALFLPFVVAPLDAGKWSGSSPN
jgi:hypothetical protein